MANNGNTDRHYNALFSLLAFRNMKRSARDYLVYFLTLIFVTALMYAFNSLIFQDDVREFVETADILLVFLALATVFIVWIVAWLIRYMVRFIMEKRSGEFGIYLLLGMKNKMVFRLYRKENFLLGITAFFPGLLAGILLREILLAVMFGMLQMEYRLHIRFHCGTFLMTALCYAGCYLLAMHRCRRKFKKMNIQALMNAKRQNEEIRERYQGARQILFPVSVLFILFLRRIITGLDNAMKLALFLVCLVLVIYLFYMGLSAWIVCYIRRKGNAIYRGQNLFLLRQFAAKLRTMQFTLGTLTALFTIALMGTTVALLFNAYQTTALLDKFPFDVQLYSPDAGKDFSRELALIQKEAETEDSYPYRIYTDGADQVNVWMYTHLEEWGTMFRNEDGSPDLEKIKTTEGTLAYCESDTYMRLSDYNYLRSMLGYGTVSLEEGQYAVHIKKRLRNQVDAIGEGLDIRDASGKRQLDCAGIYDEPFSQDGHNGGDYMVIVPDSVMARMKPFYSELVVKLEGTAPVGLAKKLDALSIKEKEAWQSEFDVTESACAGSDNIVNYAVANLVRDNAVPEIKYMFISMIIPLFYIGLVFVCVAVTVLSVQQLSDSAKYRFRYDVLKKLGLNSAQIGRLIFLQLAAYYLCPAVLAVAISSMVLSVSRIFVRTTGVAVAHGIFFLQGIGLFFGVYIVYFVLTYVGFRRNVGAAG